MNDLAAEYLARFLLETRDAIGVLEPEQFEELAIVFKGYLTTLIDLKEDNYEENISYMFNSDNGVGTISPSSTG